MGFGWLLIGYFVATMMSFNIFGALFKIIGFCIAGYGTKKLAAYHKSFSFLGICCALMIVASLLCAIGNISNFLYDNMVIASKLLRDGLYNAFNYARAVAELVFNVVLCLAVSMLAKDAGERKITYISIRNLVIYCIYFVLQFICWLPHEYVGELLQATALPAVVQIFNFVIILLNILMIFSCYRRICDEEDVEMPQKPSKFEFVNRMREEREQRELERQAKFNKSPSQNKLEGAQYSDEQRRRSVANAKKKKKNK
jgi:hypothetical protein